VAIELHEAKLFGLLLNGTYLLKGFRNRDIPRQLEHRTKSDPALRRKASGCITRLLRLLRAHSLIRKVSHHLYYRVTNVRQRLMTTVLGVHDTDVALFGA